MVSLDVRTRRDAEVRQISATEFFETELPALAAERGHLAVAAARELNFAPFTVCIGDESWTVAVVGNAITVAPGDSGEGCVRLDGDELASIVNDLATPMTYLTAGTLKMERGNLGDFLDWWVVIRSLIDGRAAHTAGAIDFRDRDGCALDVRRTFGPNDPAEDMAHFLAEAGFLHIAGLFSTDEMAAISRDIDAALPLYRPDDGRSWWATTADGTHRAVRLQRFQEHSPTTASLLADERLLRVGALTDDERIAPSGCEALEKPIGVVQGISDVPWHKDCSLGRHSYACSGLTVGISVTGADAESGQLRVVAGSHRALVQPAFVRREWQLPVVDLPTEPGDITVHCSCTLHMSQPPVTRERRVLYTGFGLRPLVAGAQAVGVDTIQKVREGSWRNVSQAPGHVAARTITFE